MDPVLQTSQALEAAFPGVLISDWIDYKNGHIYRVIWPRENEEHYDPFVYVDLDGTVTEFDFANAPDRSEISRAFLMKEYKRTQPKEV